MSTPAPSRRAVPADSAGSSVAALAAAYIALWNADDLLRPRLLAGVFAEGARYVDPNVDLDDPARIDHYISLTRRHLGGAEFAIVGPVRTHHGAACFTWAAAPPGSSPIASGIDFVQLAGERISVLHGFFDTRTPSTETPNGGTR